LNLLGLLTLPLRTCANKRLLGEDGGGGLTFAVAALALPRLGLLGDAATKTRDTGAADMTGNSSTAQMTMAVGEGVNGL
jgi:hypothetical protein